MAGPVELTICTAIECLGESHPCPTTRLIAAYRAQAKALVASERFRMEDGMDKSKLQTFIVTLTAERDLWRTEWQQITDTAALLIAELNQLR